MWAYFRRSCFALGLMVAIAPLGTAIAATDTGKWVSVKTDSENRTWYVDSGTITGKGRYRFFWSYVVASAPFLEAGKMVYGTAYYLSVDCQGKQFRLRFVRLLDQNSQTVKEFNYGDGRPLGNITSGSGEEASFKYVCKKK